MPQCQFLFSVVFLFHIFTKGNILGIGQNKSQGSYFSDTKMKSKGETEMSREAATPCHGTGPPLAMPGYGVGPSGAHRHCPSAYILPPM
jgi:hypothetical protein